MASLDEVEAAFMRAHSAGDRAAAEALAGEVKRMRGGEKKTAPLADDPGFWKTLPIAAGRTVSNVMDGMTQLYLGARGEDSALGGLKQLNQSDSEAYKPLQEARPWATGIGEALPSMIIPAGGAATMLGNAGRMATAGAIPGMLEYGTVGERLKRGAVGAASGAVVPVLGAGVKTGASLLEPIFQGGRETIAGRTLNRVAGGNAATVRAKLAGAQSLVPGSMPTAAQVAESGGIAALERSAAASNPEAYTTRAMEQASARVGALRNIAGDDAQIAAAQAARESVTKPLYDQAKSAVYTVDDKLATLLNRPAVKKAMDRAKNLAENDGRRFGFETTTSSPFAGVGGPGPVTTRRVTGQGLQDLKMAIDDMLIDPSSGVVGAEARQVQNLRGQILDWMETANPVFKQARTTFAGMSKPINQMQVGQELLNKVQPALADFGALGQESGATFARALRNTDQMVRKATDFKGAGSLDDLMGSQNMGVINGVAQDLARKSNAQNLGRGAGSDTFQKLSMQNIAEQSGMPRLAGGLLNLPGVSRATAWAYRDTDQKMQELLADALLTPSKAAALMEKADKRWLQNNPNVRRALEQAAIRSGGLLGMASTSALAEPAQ